MEHKIFWSMLLIIFYDNISTTKNTELLSEATKDAGLETKAN
jgi:hypothetical protein